MKQNSVPGIGCAATFQIALIALKLVHVIDWSWWLVCAPGIFVMAVTAVLWIMIVTEAHTSTRKVLKALRQVGADA